MGEILRHVAAVLPQFTLACLVLAALPGLSRVTVRRRLERILGTTLIGLGVDLAAATR